jgi:hypothetical protein
VFRIGKYLGNNQIPAELTGVSRWNITETRGLAPGIDLWLSKIYIGKKIKVKKSKE